MEDSWCDKPCKHTIPSKNDSQAKIERLREKVDEIDSQIALLLADRHELILEIAQIKKLQGIAVHDHDREQLIMNRIKARVSEQALPFVAEVYKAVLKASRSVQSK